MGDVVIECDQRLVSLFQRSFPDAEVRAQSLDSLLRETMHDFDYAIPAGSLPQWFRPALDAFPDRSSFVVADPERVDAWRARLAEIGPGPYAGMSWRSRLNTAERRLEYTRLDEWGPILSVPGVTWVNLQYDDCERELAAAERTFGVTLHRWEWLDLMNDFEEMAALTTALDLVVAAQRGRDARRRRRRPDRDDGKSVGLVGPRFGHVAVVPHDQARLPPPGRGMGRSHRDRRPPPCATFAPAGTTSKDREGN